MDPSFSLPPFPAFPSITRYVPLGSLEEGLARVCRSIDAREAVSLVIGPPGTGKSLLCALLVDHYRRSHEVVVLGETPIDDRAAFLRHLLHHLGADFLAIPDGDLQLALIDRVCSPNAPEGGLLLIIDEAQSLSPEVIESIRMVTNIMRDGEPRVFAVLCGGVKLDEILVDTSMEAFTQRVATRCYLHPMNGEETRRYVTETIRICGAEPNETISGEAIAAVHHACSGVPRLINQMMTLAIDCAEESGQAQITEQIIDRAWAQLHQLPSPMVEEPIIMRQNSTIEFGELDDSRSGRWSHSDESNRIESNTAPTEVSHCQAASARIDSDIELESSTAAFVEEPAQPRFPSAELFGDFDQEEEVDLGNGVVRQSPVSPTPKRPNLEEMLRQEIVGISSFAESYQEIGTLAVMNQSDDDTDAYVEESEPHAAGVLHVVRADRDCEIEAAANPVLRVSDAEDVDDRDQDRAGDDSDILVIEDEIELQRVDPAARLDSKDQTISVDFEAMLARMRSGR